MASVEERALIAPCGAFCGRCPLYLARTDKAMRQKMADRQGIPLDKVVVCAGCRQLRGKVKVAGGDPICHTYACAVNDRNLEFCYECDNFPCANLLPCADRSREIPHNLKVYNLVRLQKEGVDAWLEHYPDRLRRYFQGKKSKPGSASEL